MTSTTFAALVEAYAKALEKAILRHPDNFALRPDEPIGEYAQVTARKLILRARRMGSRSILLGPTLGGVIRRLGFAPAYTGLDECLKVVTEWPEVAE